MRESECFLEGGHLVALGIERTDLGERHVVHLALTVSGAVNRGIVHENEAAIGCGANIEFEKIGARIDSCLKGRQCIFHMRQMFAAMQITVICAAIQNNNNICLRSL